MFRLIITLTAFITFTGCNDKKNPPLKTDEQKASYTIGWQIGQGMKAQGVDANVDLVAAAIDDVLKGRKSRLTDKEKTEAIQKMREKLMAEKKQKAEKSKAEGLKFLEENKKKSGVKTTKSGLQYKVLTNGKGPKPSANSKVRVHYVGKLLDDTEFDSSRKRGTPAEFPVKGVIPGWTEALQLMSKGSKWMLYIPSNLAYGERGRPSIPANSVLVFEVELLDILKNKTKKTSKKLRKKGK